jgi:lipopolysaccharide transport system ATP-binding protein
MSDVAICVEGLGKQYRIGVAQGGRYRYRTIRETLVDAAKGPFRRAGRIIRGQSAAELDDTIWALKDVSFEVQRGEVVGIIGRNGAGKSTLLKVLSRITEPTEGEAWIHGRVGSLLEVGTGFHPELTGRENVYLNGAILGMKRAEIARKFDEIVDFAELEKFIDTPVKHYSSGMYVRLAFSVAAYLEPEMLLVDEVLAVGDAAFQKKCLGKMGAVAREGRTVLFVSHNMNAVRRLCGRVIWLREGAVETDGPVSSVTREYLTDVVAGAPGPRVCWSEQAVAPGNEHVRLRLVSIKADGGEGSLITVDTPIRFEFEFWNNVEGAILNLSVHVSTVDNIRVFAVASESVARSKGLIWGSFRLPSHFLNEGDFAVSLHIVRAHSQVLASFMDVVSFSVIDSGRESTWHGKWPGVVRPRLQFTTGAR